MRKRNLLLQCLVTALLLMIGCNEESNQLQGQEPQGQEIDLSEIDYSIKGDGSHKVISYLRQNLIIENLNDRYYDNHSHIILFLSNTKVDADGHIEVTEEVDRILTEAVRLRGDRDTKLMLGFPGGNDFFVPLSNDAVHLDNYLNDIKSMAIKYGLDGVDIDWEHPEAPDQQKAAGVFAKRAFEILKPEGLILSQAIIWYNLGHMNATIEYLDFINVMIYDNFTDEYYHSPYSQFTGYVDNLLAKGIPKEKFVAGLPFYGYTTKKEWADKKSYRYAHILESLNAPVGADEVLNEQGETVSFDGVLKIWKKCAYALEKDLGGVMIWESHMDIQDYTSNKSLLRHVNSVFPINN